MVGLGHGKCLFASQHRCRSVLERRVAMGKLPVDGPDAAGGRTGSEDGVEVCLIGGGEGPIGRPGKRFVDWQPHQIDQFLLHAGERGPRIVQIGRGRLQSHVEHRLIVWVAPRRHQREPLVGIFRRPCLHNGGQVLRRTIDGRSPYPDPRGSKS